jgi:hypothetical protein
MAVEDGLVETSPQMVVAAIAAVTVEEAEMVAVATNS